MKTVAFCTLGCKVNSYDTGMMAKLLKDDGYSIVDFEEMADVYIINSCTVTGTGDKKSRQMVGKARKTNPKALICMAGCYSQTEPELVAKLGVDLVIGTSNRKNIVDLLIRAKDSQVIEVSSDLKDFEDCESTYQESRTRAFLKVQDGCNNRCTYCIIPFARGNSRSRKTASILLEANNLVNDGFREIVITGIHIASFGKDSGESLLSLLKELAKIEKLRRIRLGSLEPTILTKEFCDEISLINKLCPSFHVSLQSGCNNTLRAMGRRYTIEEYANNIDNLRQAYKNPSITTDVMVGFPTESESDFMDSLKNIDDLKLSKCHIFPYSIRKGTKAGEMKEQIPKAEKTKRAKLMAQKTTLREKEYIVSFENKNKKVLFEQELEKNLFSGYTDNYIRVYAKGENLLNEIKTVALDKEYKDGLMGHLV